MNKKNIQTSSRLETHLTDLVSRERAPSKRLKWAIYGKIQQQTSERGPRRAYSDSGILRIALRLVRSEAKPRFKHDSRLTLRRNLLILSTKLKLQN